ncbi:hypothetical protein ACFW04_013202 [Cataglyphis niger]
MCLYYCASSYCLYISFLFKNNNNGRDNYRIINKDNIIRNIEKLVKVQGRLVIQQIKKGQQICSNKGDIIIIDKLNSRKFKVLETKVKSIKIVKSGFNQDIKLDIIERFRKKEKELFQIGACHYRNLAKDDKNKIICTKNIRKQNNKINGKILRNIIMTFEGNKLPEQLSLFDRLTAIRIRPYISSVK